MDVNDLKGKYMIAEIPNNPFDCLGNPCFGLYSITLPIQGLQRAKEYVNGFIEEREKNGEIKTYAIIEIKQIISNWSADKEIDKIEKQMLELQKRKEDMSRNME